jgi:hypothetical protein
MSSAIDLVKRKSHQLCRAFPAHFTLSKAQEATAECLGFDDWFALHSACKSGLGILPRQLSTDTDLYLDVLRRSIVTLADRYDVLPSLAHEFILGWGLFAPILAAPFEYPYFAISRVASELSDEVEIEDFAFRRVVDGIVEACPHYKHAYWFLSPERHQALKPALRGQGGAYLSHEDAAFVVLAFPNEFAEEAKTKAAHYVTHEQPLAGEWLWNLRGARPPLFVGTYSQLLDCTVAHLDSWFALSYRWAALPYDHNRRNIERPNHLVVPALKGRHFREMLAAKGALSLADVSWFSAKPLFRKNKLDLDIFSLEDQWQPLRVAQFDECEAHYASPFKHYPLDENEYQTMAEGGDAGLGYRPLTDIPEKETSV